MTKSELRRLLKDRRAAIDPERRRELDRAIVGRIAESDLFRNCSSLLLYAPIGSEINLLPLVRVARQAGIPVAFPRAHEQDCTMEFYTLTEDARLTPGAYGIPEPPEGAPLCVPDDRALCIVPALSFDLFGYRLGYGKGYYDRFLSTFPGTAIGVCYEELLTDAIPTERFDLPVAAIVTEDRIERATPRADEAARRERWSKRLRRGVVDEWKNLLSDRKKNPPALAPAALVLAIGVLVLLARLFGTFFPERGSSYLGITILQILIFLIPSVLYCKLRREQTVGRFALRAVRLRYLPFLFFLLIFMISLGIAIEILTGGIRSLSGGFTLYSAFTAGTAGGASSILAAILSYGILPAVGEEIVFRAILCAEYERPCGVAVSIPASAFFFALIHFSVAHFPTYFLLGLLLAWSGYATRSLFAPILLHIGYNVFCLFGQPVLSAFYVTAGSTEIFLFFLGILLFLSAALVAGEARKIYHGHAGRGEDSSLLVGIPKRVLPRTIVAALSTLPTLACILLYAVVCAVW